MELIKRNTDYAVRALCYFAKHKGEVVRTNNLVAALDLPKPYIRRILQRLGAEGLLTSTRGKRGGFTLSRRLDHISMSYLITIFQGHTKICKHIFKKKPCPEIKNCRLKKKLDKLERLVVSVLDSIKISSLVR